MVASAPATLRVATSHEPSGATATEVSRYAPPPAEPPGRGVTVRSATSVSSVSPRFPTKTCVDAGPRSLSQCRIGYPLCRIAETALSFRSARSVSSRSTSPRTSPETANTGASDAATTPPTPPPRCATLRASPPRADSAHTADGASSSPDAARTKSRSPFAAKVGAESPVADRVSRRGADVPSVAMDHRLETYFVRAAFSSDIVVTSDAPSTDSASPAMRGRSR
ncbi:hypothetical protein QE397_001104 [Rhodococcus sp. SORGH_AS 301]|nr:hypothetical protein [Rhodococcus sp. SORGH_AS_0301]